MTWETRGGKELKKKDLPKLWLLYSIYSTTFFEKIMVWYNHENEYILGICLLLSLKTTEICLEIYVTCIIGTIILWSKTVDLNLRIDYKKVNVSPMLYFMYTWGVGNQSFQFRFKAGVPLVISHESAIFVSSNGSRTLQQAQNHCALLFLILHFCGCLPIYFLKRLFYYTF